MTEPLSQHPVPVDCGRPAATRRWPLGLVLGLGALIGALLGLAVALCVPKRWTATATLLFPAASAPHTPQRGTPWGIPDRASAEPKAEQAFDARTAMLLVHSRRMESDLVMGDAELSLPSTWKLPVAAARERFRRRLQCEVGAGGELYIRFTDGSPTLSYSVATAVLTELELVARELGYDEGANVRLGANMLQAELAQAESELAKVRNEMIAFQRKYRIIAPDEEAKLLANQYASLQQEVIRRRIDAETALRELNMQATNASNLIQACLAPAAGAENTLAPLYQKVMTLEGDLALLTQRKSDQVEAKTEELKVARGLLNAEIKRQMALLKTGSSPMISAAVIDAAAAKARYEGLRSAVQLVQQAIDGLPKQQAQYAGLSARLDDATARVRQYRAQVEQARLQAQTARALYRVLDLPEQPVVPDPAPYLPCGLAGLLVGLAGAGVLLRPRRARPHPDSVAPAPAESA